MKQKALFADITVEQLPKHIAIIMDGNRRWAKLNKFNNFRGHKKGADKLSEIVKFSYEIGIKYLTVYAFSSENWSRSEVEIQQLKSLLMNFLKQSIKQFKDYKVAIKIIGDYQRFGKEISNKLEETISLFPQQEQTQLVLNIALSYGGREEIINTIKNLEQAELEKLDQESFAKKLYTGHSCDPDLLIRTGGEFRISNFLLWQIAYSELFFTKTLWPDFSQEEFCQIIADFIRRERRYGR